jgi:hypothetical protein
MAAERDGLAVLVTAIGVAAVAALEIDERDQARFDPHATELDGFGARQRRLGLHRRGLHCPAARRLRDLRGRGALVRRGTRRGSLGFCGPPSPMRLPRPIAALRV